MKQIPLSGMSGAGKFTLVDDQDYASVASYKWHRHSDGSVIRKKYLGYSAASKRGLYKGEFMHRLIMSAPEGLVVDHIDGNKLNNQRSNLRVCTQAENVRHTTRLRSDNTSGYVGVKKGKTEGSWDAYITYDYKVIYIGRFYNKADAAKAYSEAATKYHKEYATSAVRGVSCESGLMRE